MFSRMWRPLPLREIFSSHTHRLSQIISGPRLPLQLVVDVDMTNRVAIVEDERIRITPPLAVIISQDPT